MKNCLAVFLFLVIFISSIGYAYAVEGEEDPTDAEKKLFEDVKKRVEGDKTNWPHDISQKLNLISSGTLELPARDCSKVEGTTVDEVRFTMKGKLIKFNSTLAKKSIPEFTDQNAGADLWSCNVSVKEVGEGDERKKVKFIECDDSLMLNVAKMPDNLASQKLMNDSILFHELLHGQLLLDAMTKDEEYLKKMCQSFKETDGKVDFEPLDSGHEKIPALQGQYFKQVGEKFGFEVSVKDFKPAAKKDCKFSLTRDQIFEGVAKEEITDGGFYPLENIKSIMIDKDTGTLSGELATNEKGECLVGKIVFYFDPPLTFVFGIVEIFPEVPVGGERLQIDTTTLLILGLPAYTLWMIPTLAGIVGAGIIIRNKLRRA